MNKKANDARDTLVLVGVLVLSGTAFVVLMDKASGGWGVAGLILSGLCALGAIGSLIEHIGVVNAEAELKRRYGELLQERLPMGRVLLVEDQAGAPLQVAKQDDFICAGMGAEKLFLVQHKKSGRKDRGGRLLFAGAQPIEMPFTGITGVYAEAVSQEKIEAAARDDREYLERVVEGAVVKMFNGPKEKIVPYACYLSLHAESPSPVSRIVVGFLTELDRASLEMAGVTTSNAEKVVEAARDKLVDAAKDQAGDTAETAAGFDAVGLADEAAGWLLPGSKSGSTNAQNALRVCEAVVTKLRSLVRAKALAA